MKDPFARLDATGEAIDARRDVVQIARGELGPQLPDRYYETAALQYLGLPPAAKSWCGVFALWCLREAGLCDWQWIDGRGFLFRLRTVSIPSPGDVAYFSAGQHHAIVERVSGGKLYTIDGNAMMAPREGVAERVRPLDAAALCYSIGCLTGEDPRGCR